MNTVTQRIQKIDQPPGGYINLKDLHVEFRKSDQELFYEENINPATIGLVVEYMTRMVYTKNKERAFDISLRGAKLKRDMLHEANALLENINGIDHVSIVNACKLVCFDQMYRANNLNVEEYRKVADFKTVANIREMIERSLDFLIDHGPVIMDGFTMPGAYTYIIHAGDGDLVTDEALWDFKVSKYPPSKDHTLQVLIYYLMGLRSFKTKEHFNQLKRIGIFNPRLNKMYYIYVKDINEEAMRKVERDVIGYIDMNKDI